MANVTCLRYEDPGGQAALAPDETRYFWLGPLDAFGSGAVTVTATPNWGEGSPGSGGMYLEVIQTATRQQNNATNSGVEYFLDVVVRNNTHASEEQHTTIESFTVYVSIITP